LKAFDNTADMIRARGSASTHDKFHRLTKFKCPPMAYDMHLHLLFYRPFGPTFTITNSTQRNLKMEK